MSPSDSGVRHASNRFRSRLIISGVSTRLTSCWILCTPPCSRTLSCSTVRARLAASRSSLSCSIFSAFTSRSSAISLTSAGVNGKGVVGTARVCDLRAGTARRPVQAGAYASSACGRACVRDRGRERGGRAYRGCDRCAQVGRARRSQCGGMRVRTLHQHPLRKPPVALYISARQREGTCDRARATQPPPCRPAARPCQPPASPPPASPLPRVRRGKVVRLRLGL
mmetsp:Transcript_41594/g.102644  ORF Transcript_41594/g.102644 Transcript_41594/m.102644 type:complete len:225 (-) Transcript_41594:1-675(-)